MKLFSKNEEKNKVGRPKLADMDLKKKSIIMCIASFMLVVTLLTAGAFKLDIISFNKMKGAANINLCTAENINPEVLYNAETNPNGFSPEFLSAVMSVGNISNLNDTSKCSTVTMEELKQVTRIDTGNSTSNKGLLTNTIGLQNLTNLTYLYLSDNNLTDINVSNLKNLEHLRLNNNQLTSIDLSNNINLKSFNLSNNRLTSINLPEGVTLEFFNLSYNELAGELDLSGISFNTSGTAAFEVVHNHLTSIKIPGGSYNSEGIDVSYNDLTSLELNDSYITWLYANNNKLENIKLNNTTIDYVIHLENNKLSEIFNLNSFENLYTIDLSNNNLSSIDVSDNKLLEELYLSNNRLDNIDVTQNTLLEGLDLSGNNLTSINLSNNKELKELSLSNNNINGTLNLSNQYNLNSLYVQNNKIDEIKFYKADNNENILEISELFLFNNNIKSLDLSAIRISDFFISNNNSFNKVYILKGEMYNYNNFLKFNDEQDYTLEIENDKIVKNNSNNIEALKYGKTKLMFLNENLIGIKDEYVDSVTKCITIDDSSLWEEQCSWLEQMEDEIIVPYFMYIDIYVYDVTSDEYKIDTENKIIDVQNKEFDINSINLHIEDLVGVVEGDKYIIKDGDNVVATYVLKNNKKTENEVVTTKKTTTKKNVNTALKNKIQTTTATAEKTTNVNSEHKKNSIKKIFKAPTIKNKKSDIKKNNIWIYIIPFLLIAIISGCILYKNKK